MTIDANLFAQYMPKTDPFSAYAQGLDEGQKFKANALAIAAQQRAAQYEQQLRTDLAGAPANIDDRYTYLMGKGTPEAIKMANDLRQQQSKSNLENAQTAEQSALANKHVAETTDITRNTEISKHDLALKHVMGITQKEDALPILMDHVKSGELTTPQAMDMYSRIPANQADIPAWKLNAVQTLLNAKDLSAQLAPDANAKLQADTSRANNAATIAGENLRAGVNQNGKLTPDMETTAKAIASGQLPAPTGMALLNPRNQRVLARVMEINPEYDSTSVTAKKTAANAFTSGQQGNAMRSFAVAGQHLDQLGQLVDALNNGNTQLINKIGNAYSAQTGNPAPTNFDAAKDIVSKEVIKAIVGSGGGVTEREELANSMSKANSPAQLKGVITQYRNLMSAQHDALLEQRRAAGLPDSTLPNYGSVLKTQPVKTQSGANVSNW